VEVRRRREHLGRHHARHEARHRFFSDRIADARSVRRLIAPATICSAIVWSRSTRVPANGCGIFRLSITTSGTNDLTAAPKLLTIRDPSDRSRTIDIVAQAGKTGFL
jgi:hypothetical protein